ncbi:uncharacterized protein LOC131249875 [Magnolia sinica]|uniref:uncharacterized protein LOC131249875 n=1 Tax=Magnolia sinica TaxID=86752 RepID=UPI0026597177|nr:uncharacterized protein LOC131249875 [Magnolia sinica]
MSSPVILLLLLSLSIHGSNARHLREAPKESMKAIEKVEFNKPSTPANLMQSLSEELQSQPIKPAADKNVIGASTSNTKDSTSLPKDMDGTRENASGSENVTSSSHVGFHQTSKLEEPGKQALLVSGSGSIVGHVTVASEEHIGSKEIDVVGDTNDMDYEQPHHKPPIHNESP